MKPAAAGAKKAPAGPLIRDTSATAATNLGVLRRSDPDVEEVLGTAGHVCLYGFDVDAKQWSRKEVEGSMFVVKRRTQPRFQFIIMNRLSIDNLVQDLLGDFEFELSPPYLLYRTGNEVNGLWFYQQEECDAMTALLNRISGAFVKSPGAAAAPPLVSDAEPAARAAAPAPAAATALPAAPPAAKAPPRAPPQQVPAPPRAAQADGGKPQLLTPDFFARSLSTGGAAQPAAPAAPPAGATPPPAAPANAPTTPAAAGAAAGAASAAGTPSAGGAISRSDVRDALLRLVMNDAFLDLVHGELTRRR